MTYFTNEEKDSDVVLLFLHGWGCDSAIFDTLTAHLSVTWYALDLCGFGRSTIAHAMSVEQYADAVHDFIASHNLSNVVVVGHSFGGRVGVVLASKYPKSVAKLVLIGGAGLRRFSFIRMVRVLKHKVKRLLVKVKLLSSSAIEKAGSSDYQAISSSVMRDTFRLVIRQDLSRFARRITCPTLLLWGKQDKDTPIWIAKRYHRLIKRSKLVFFNGSHFVFLSHSIQIASLIEGLALEE